MQSNLGHQVKDGEKQMPPHPRLPEELRVLEHVPLLSNLTVWILCAFLCHFTTQSVSLGHKAGPSSAATAFVPGGCGQGVQDVALYGLLLWAPEVDQHLIPQRGEQPLGI